ncbi:MAG TPA: T9SS type A sorting domain-containing protein [Chitinophagales bacterium]|nr:T9SS type A sorting domain-containing protein [Chitinophagales bacterium]
MKRAFVMAWCSMISLSAITQPNYCGTTMPHEMTAWLKNHQRHASARMQADESVYNIPLTAHIVGNDQGGGYYKLSNLLDALCKLNEDYLPVGFHFYLYDDVNYINKSSLYEHGSGFSITSTINQNNVRNTANIYFVQDPAGNCGYFQYWGDFIAVAKSCAGPNNSTVAHELGHYFSLPHTFSGWEGRARTEPAEWDDERVDGSNCATAGDGFCDTPADFISDRWSCPYNDTKLDYNGDPYNVDGSLYMSYANDACQNKFSPEQIEAMRSYLLDSRASLLNHPAPVNDTVSATRIVFPPNNSGFPLPANYVQLKWMRAMNATHYHLQVTRYFNGTFFNVDTFMRDTTIVLTNLEAGYNYRWRVRPFNQGYTCAEYTPYSNFTTRAATSIIPNYSISGITCPGETDGSIQVGASGGTGPYTFTWSTGSSGQSLTNLNEGSYSLTITDSGTDSLILSFDIAEPEPLDANIVQSSNVLSAIVTGGTPPYNYQWSNGITVPQNTVAGAGEYSLTVTDSHGCSVTKSFFFTGISALQAADTRIYPNPLTHGAVLTLEVAAAETFRGAIELLDNTGKRIFSAEKTFTAGANKETFILPALSGGIYLFRITGEEAPFIKRVMVR